MKKSDHGIVKVSISMLGAGSKLKLDDEKRSTT